MTDEMNANVQHNNDPVVRSSLGKAGMVIANALSSPRRVGFWYNRGKELARPTLKPTHIEPRVCSLLQYFLTGRILFFSVGAVLAFALPYLFVRFALLGVSGKI